MYFRPSEENFRSGNKCQNLQNKSIKLAILFLKNRRIPFFLLVNFF